MKWRIGLRTADLLFTSRPTSRGRGSRQRIFNSISNNFWGIGPHAGVELRSRPNSWGLGWVGKLDSGLLFGQVHQEFVGHQHRHQHEIDFINQQEVPMLSGFLGLDWRPRAAPTWTCSSDTRRNTGGTWAA